VSRVFGDESFQAITCTGTDNTKRTIEHTPKTQNKQTGPTLVKYKKTHRKPSTKPKSLAVPSS